MHLVLVARRVVLALVGLAFAAIAAGSLVSPHEMAAPLGYRLDNANAFNEFRAIYVGLWLAHAALCLWAAWKVELRFLGDVVALLLAGQVLGRLLSLVVDGPPDARLLPAIFAEVVGATLVMSLRGPNRFPSAIRHLD
jgi:hypothetical protein